MYMTVMLPMRSHAAYTKRYIQLGASALSSQCLVLTAVESSEKKTVYNKV